MHDGELFERHWTGAAADDRAIQATRTPAPQRCGEANLISDDTFNRDAWLRRIGHGGSLTPTLATLRAVVAAHATSIPYENIDVFLGRPPKLDVKSLQQKMVAGGRGGYCFEQNMLLRAGLLSLGFDVTGYVARVTRGVVTEGPRPALFAGHMVLRVDLPEGNFLVDVGFGNLTPTAPLVLCADIEQETPHETMRLVLVGEDLTLQVKLGTEWENLYRLMPQPRSDPDFEVANWYVATHPDSLFVKNLIVARPGTAAIRYTLFNGRLSERRPPDRLERRMLEDATDYQMALADTFGIALSTADVSAVLDMLELKGVRGATHTFFT
jgi:N-hydroxyarylamine O-acetyltransferase